MKLFISILIIFFSSLNNSKAQTFYLLDSLTTISFLNGNFNNIHESKFHYNDEFRLISENSLNYEITYEYLNNHDYIRTNFSKVNSIIQNRKSYYYNQDGYLIEEYTEEYDYNDEILRPRLKLSYEYDDLNRIINRKRYFINNSGTEMLQIDKDIIYNDYGIVQEFTTQYVLNSTEIYFTGTVTNQYENGLISSSSSESIFETQTNTSEKTYLYENNDLVSRESFHYVDDQFKYAYLNLYDNTDHGVFRNQFYKEIETAEYEARSILYESENITPFYTQDTSISTLIVEDESFENRKYFNSHFYTTSEDTAMVRKERRSRDSDIDENIQVTREIHIRFGNPTSAIDELEFLVEISPNPISVDGFINIKLIDSEIDKYEIFNTLGRRIEIGSIWAKNTLIKSPALPGQYYIRFFKGNIVKAEIIKFSVY